MRPRRMKPHHLSASPQAGGLLLLLLVVIGAGCRTSVPMPPADFASGGWQVRHGQAVWKPSKSQPELAGELLLATRTNGDYFVQFDKIPFPLATAQTERGQWHIRFGTGRYAWHGRGEPPGRFVWFQLPRALASQPLAKHWTLERNEDAWSLKNSRTGEMLEGNLTP
jgi:hypothetical protein